jgi:hypothetical protein
MLHLHLLRSSRGNNNENPSLDIGIADKTYAVGDDVGVAVERSLGVTVLRLITRQVPDDQSLVTAAGKEHVGAAEKNVSLRS